MMKKLVASLLAAISICGIARAALLDDFESYAVGTDIGTDAAWTVEFGTMEVAVDPTDAGNKVLSISGDTPVGANGYARGYLNFAPISQTDDSSKFSFRVMWSNGGSGDNDGVLGLSDSSTPINDWNDYAPIVRAAGGNFDCRNINTYETLFAVAYDTWYDVEFALYQSTETYDISVNGSPVKTGAGYRQQGTNGDLVSFLLRDSSGVGTMYVDDIQSIPEPATLGMIAVFGGGLLFIRRTLKF